MFTSRVSKESLDTCETDSFVRQDLGVKCFSATNKVMKLTECVCNFDMFSVYSA